jgi:hypothetical protein
MKHLIVLSILFSLLITLPSCKKGDAGPAGPAGAQGPAGPQGPIGIAGNANVTQYVFAGRDFAADASITLQINTTADTTARSVFYVYLVRANGLVYPIPGFGFGGTSDYRTYWSFSSQANIFISKVSGPGESYGNIRVVRLYASNVVNAAKQADTQPEVDFRDYYAVCKYYNLPY